MTARKFVLATSNPNKIREVQEILSDSPIMVQSLQDFPEVILPEENGKTYEENARLKAAAVAMQLGVAALADDSGLEVDALGGKPGIFSNRFLGENAGYDIKNKHILKLLEKMPDEKRGARFVCAAALAFPDGSVHVERGEVHGKIAREMKGAGGFGYDPIFFLPEHQKTMAELSAEEKNKISHRAKAFQKLRDYLTGLPLP